MVECLDEFGIDMVTDFLNILFERWWSSPKSCEKSILGTNSTSTNREWHQYISRNKTCRQIRLCPMPRSVFFIRRGLLTFIIRYVEGYNVNIWYEDKHMKTTMY